MTLVHIPKFFFLISPPKHVVGTQKDCFDEMVLLSTQNMLKLMGKKNIYNFTLKNLVHLNLGV